MQGVLQRPANTSKPLEGINLLVRHGTHPMSALGGSHKRTFALHQPMSALPPIATAKANFRTRSCLLSPESEHVRCS
jgi:hypothetical protein